MIEIFTEAVDTHSDAIRYVAMRDAGIFGSYNI